MLYRKLIVGIAAFFFFVNSVSNVNGSVSAATLANNSPSSIQRIYGVDRYETSIEASKSGWPDGSDNLIIADDKNSADSVCAIALAAKLKSPLLLIGNNELGEKFLDEIKRLKTKKIYIIGGQDSINKSIEDTLRSMDIEVIRVSGSDRYDTSLSITNIIGQSDSVFIIGGKRPFDGIALASICSIKGASILLADDDNLNDSELDYIKKAKNVYVIGGEKIISDKLLNKLPNHHRISGNNRYETNINILNYFMDELNFSTSYFVHGEDFSDGISGAMLSIKSKSPVIFVKENLEESTKVFIESNNFLFNNKFAVGGEKVLPLNIFTDINYNKNQNSINPLKLKTYDNSGQACHPKILYFKDGFNGWKYWMAFTPYEYSNDLNENPSILVSNDGVNWQVPKGIAEPLINSPEIRGIHYSDTHLLYNPDTKKMELWFRYTFFNKLDIIYRIVSDNGISWSEPQNMLSSNDGNMILSPAIIYENGTYKMWYVSFEKNQLRCRRADSYTGTSWFSKRDVYLNLPLNYVPWHLDVVHTDVGYEMLLDSFRSGEIEQNNRILMWGTSIDGEAFANMYTILKPSPNEEKWDNQQIYRSTFVKVNGIYRLYYSAMGKDGKWHIGLTQGKDLLNLHGYN